MKLLWSEEAITKLQEIDKYISKDNPDAALDLIDKIFSLAETIIENPEKGRVVPELSLQQIGEVLYMNYRIVYIIRKNSIEILTVFEGHKQLDKEEIIKNKFN
jgi:addiction module RelE/StbE family toxin